MVVRALLRPRVMRPVHAVPGVDGMDLQDGAPDVEGKGRKETWTPSSTSPSGVRAHDLCLLQAARRTLVSYIEKFARSSSQLSGAEPVPKLTIDGVELEVAAGTSVLEAAKQAGVEVPHYCYHPGLSIGGSAVCMVTSTRCRAPRSAEHMTVAEGMVVHTKTSGSWRRGAPSGVPPDQPPARLPGLRPGRRVAAADLYMRHGLYDTRMR